MLHNLLDAYDPQPTTWKPNPRPVPVVRPVVHQDGELGHGGSSRCCWSLHHYADSNCSPDSTGNYSPSSTGNCNPSSTGNHSPGRFRERLGDVEYVLG